MEPTQNLLSTELQIDSFVFSHLKETAMWAKFLGIVGFVFSALILLVSFFAGTFMASVPSAYSMPAGLGGAVTVFYILIAALSFFLSLQAYRFGIRTNAALLNDDQQALTAGLGNLKTLFRTYGIVIIIYLGFIVLALVFGLIGAIFMKH